LTLGNRPKKGRTHEQKKGSEKGEASVPRIIKGVQKKIPMKKAWGAKNRKRGQFKGQAGTILKAHLVMGNTATSFLPRTRRKKAKPNARLPPSKGNQPRKYMLNSLTRCPKGEEENP